MFLAKKPDRLYYQDFVSLLDVHVVNRNKQSRQKISISTHQLIAIYTFTYL